jgi:hypothetical protein
MSLLNIIK